LKNSPMSALLTVFTTTLLLFSGIAVAETETETVAPPVFSSTRTAPGEDRMLQDGKVIVTETTVSTVPTASTTTLPPSEQASRTETPANRAKTTQTTQGKTESKEQPTSTTKTTVMSPSTTTTLASDQSVVEGKKINNPASMDKEELSGAGTDLRPYLAIAILMFVAGKTSYTRASKRR